jgi:pimeloyl-ACP methyl ester carboxylesterase
MDDLTPPEYVTRPDSIRLAFRQVTGNGGKTQPTLVFLPGYKSDMQGSKALAVEDWAIKNGHAMLRLDYSGCGESGGAFEDGTLNMWRDDALLIIREVVRGPIILIGSSMGGWLMLMLAKVLGEQVRGLIGIAAAPDFTDWGFSDAEKATIARVGKIERASDYEGDPMVTTRGFWQSGQDNLQLHGEIPLRCPVRLLQGQCDDAVPWQTALALSKRLCSADVQVTLVKDGDHRLSRDQDIALLMRTIKDLLDCL